MVSTLHVCDRVNRLKNYFEILNEQYAVFLDKINSDFSKRIDFVGSKNINERYTYLDIIKEYFHSKKNPQLSTFKIEIDNPYITLTNKKLIIKLFFDIKLKKFNILYFCFLKYFYKERISFKYNITADSYISLTVANMLTGVYLNKPIFPIEKIHTSNAVPASNKSLHLFIEDFDLIIPILNEQNNLIPFIFGELVITKEFEEEVKLFYDFNLSNMNLDKYVIKITDYSI